MKFLGRFVFGLLVMLAGLNVFLYSYVDMTGGYLVKYGNEAIEEGSDLFFRSIYGYYSEDYLIDEDITGDYDFRLWVFVGSNSTENHLRVQIEQPNGLDLPDNYFIRLILPDDEKVDIYFQDTKSDLWHASSINLLALLSGQEAYIDILDLQIIESEQVTTGEETQTVETILFDYSGTLLLSKDNMDILLLSKTNTEDQMLALGYIKGIEHDFFKEFQYILWRNVGIFVVIVSIITYLLFFRKRKYTPRSVTTSKEVITRNNLNTRVIEEVKMVEDKENNDQEK